MTLYLVTQLKKKLKGFRVRNDGYGTFWLSSQKLTVSMDDTIKMLEAAGFALLVRTSDRCRMVRDEDGEVVTVVNEGWKYGISVR